MRDAPINVRRIGSGPRIVFVHGAMTTSEQSWAKQQPLAERWQLVILDRRGYDPSPAIERSDFAVDASDIAELLEDGSHLVGHSYGAIGALFAAAERPGAVRSLTVVEPPVHALMRGHPSIEEQIADHAHRCTITDPVEFLRAFRSRLGLPTDGIGGPLPEAVEQQVRVLMHERPPWEEDVPVDAIRAGGFPVLVVSGGHDETFEQLCDRLAETLGDTARREVIHGRGHAVQRTGEPFNDCLERFLREQA